MTLPAGTVADVVRRLVLVAVTVLSALVVQATPARACSCAPPTRDTLAAVSDADAAFVGRLTRTDDPSVGPVVSSARTVHHRFEVEAVAKGAIGPTVVVDAAAEGASCGLEAREGERVGLLLRREGSSWRSSLCSRIDPDALVAVSSPPTRPSGNGLGPNVLAAAVLGAVAIALTAAIDARARHDPAPPQQPGS